MNNPLVSIIIPTYNRAHLISETLDSIVAQTYTNWECIIVDDKSTDNSFEVINAYCIKDNRFQYHQRPSDRLKGGNSARNYGFELSKGEYINWLDSDDVFSENKIQTQILSLTQSNSDIATCKWGRFNNSKDINIKNQLGIYKNYSRGFNLIADYGKYGEFFPSHVFFIRRNLIYKAGHWNENLKINQDGEFFCRLLLKAKKVDFCEKSYVLYRVNDIIKTSNVTGIIKAKHIIISWKLIESYLNLIDEKIFVKYLEAGKEYSFEKLKTNYNNLLLKEKMFFYKQFKKRGFFSKLKRKLF